MPDGMEPLNLFRVVAHNRWLLDKLRSTGSYLLNFGTLPPPDRELIIHRTCARCGCEYEWGVHAAVYSQAVGLSEDQLHATVTGAPTDPAFTPDQTVLIELVDSLHDTSNVSDRLWERLAERYDAAQLVEAVTLVGQYHTVSYMANALGVELEEAARRFPSP